MSHESKNLTPLPTGRQATPTPLNPPKGEVHVRGEQIKFWTKNPKTIREFVAISRNVPMERT